MPENVGVEKDEIMVTQMDTKAMLKAFHGILPIRKGTLVDEFNPSKELAFWVYKKNMEIDKILLYWSLSHKSQVEMTLEQKMFAADMFRTAQFESRMEKAKMERRR